MTHAHLRDIKGEFLLTNVCTTVDLLSLRVTHRVPSVATCVLPQGKSGRYEAFLEAAPLPSKTSNRRV